MLYNVVNIRYNNAQDVEVFYYDTVSDTIYSVVRNTYYIWNEKDDFGILIIKDISVIEKLIAVPIVEDIEFLTLADLDAINYTDYCVNKVHTNILLKIIENLN